MTIEGSFSSSASPSLANNNWSAVFRYDTSFSEDMSSGIYYSAITSAIFTTSGNTYVGIPGNLGSLGGTTLPGDPFAPAGTYVQITDDLTLDRIEYRGRFYLDGDPQQQDIELFEIVLADQSNPSLLDSSNLPETFDFSRVDYTSFATRLGNSTLDGGTITSASVTAVPEPSAIGLVVVTAGLAIVLRRRKTIIKENQSLWATAKSTPTLNVAHRKNKLEIISS